MSEYLIYIFIFLYYLVLFFSSILEYINSKNWKDSVPDSLKDFYKESDYKKAKSYKLDRDKVSLISSLISTTLTIIFIFSGVYGKVSDYSLYYFDNPFLQSAGFFLFFLLISTIISLPISYYSIFTIEEKYGFQQNYFSTFYKRQDKGLNNFSINWWFYSLYKYTTVQFFLRLIFGYGSGYFCQLLSFLQICSTRP